MNYKTLARTISLVENEVFGYKEILQHLQLPTAKVIGITGPPGAGKSTLTDALVGAFVADNKLVGVLCVDPSSPFNLGALLGDRIRMCNWYNHPNVFIRSLATRGSLGGLHPHIIEIMSVMQAAGFDYIIVETVGVGQSEIEIAGLADTTVVVVVPESGDEVQTMKAGLMEIADIFVVNKSDRPDADSFVTNLRQLLAPTYHNTIWQVPIIKTIALQKQGIDELVNCIQQHLQQLTYSEKKYWLLAERAYQIIQQERMKDVDKMALLSAIKANYQHANFNLFQFVNSFFF
ncbi:MAG: methylmalonyl Co-A mutase-associated GTPase MeaB [Flavobacterium sp.]|nr:methylmalonyl Co-A mutase-associated GTPase MeaB [Flavobacterium sp.]